MSAVARFVEQARGERPLEQLSLAEKLALPSGRKAGAVLVRTASTALVVAALEEEGAALDLLDGGELRYERGLPKDRLRVDGQAFGVPAGRGRLARRLLALARLQRAAPSAPDGLRPPESVTVRSPSAVERAFLRGLLKEDEELLAWLPTGSTMEVPSAIADAQRWPQMLLVTDKRSLLVALSDLGDTLVEEAEAPAVSGGLLRREAPDGPLAALWSLTDAEPAARRLAIARLNWRARKERASYRARAAMLLRRALDEGDPLGTLSAFFLRRPLGLDGKVDLADLDEALARIDEGEALARWWRAWGLDPAAGMLVVERWRLRGLPPAGSLPLHDAIWWESGVDDPVERGRADVERAEHQLAAGQPAAAAESLVSCLRSLPGPEVDDFLPDHRPDLSEVRARALDLLATARPEEAPRSLVRLVQRTPLSTRAVARLAEEGEGWSATAAAEVARLLTPGGLERPEHVEVPGPVKPLDPDHIAELEHPASRGSSAVGVLQAYLAVAKEPDRASLRAFCERLRKEEHPEAAAALADALVLLGAPSVDAFVSRGEKGIGLRGYEGKPAYLLIGGHHLDETGPFFLDPVELRFAVAAEVAHVRFKHRRMTPSEVWAGAWEKSRAGLDLVFTILPAFKGWDMAEKLFRAVTLTRSAVGKVDKAARQAIKEESLGVRLEDLVDAHRLMQLTADRAGLVLAGDLAGALRAMFRLDPTLRAELSVIERHGLPEALLRRGEEEALHLPDALIRVCALIGFYVSGTYQELQHAARESPEPRQS